MTIDDLMKVRNMGRRKGPKEIIKKLAGNEEPLKDDDETKRNLTTNPKKRVKIKSNRYYN